MDHHRRHGASPVELSRRACSRVRAGRHRCASNLSTPTRCLPRANQSKDQPKDPSHVLELLHRSADFRHGALHRHRDSRRGRVLDLPIAQYPEVAPPVVQVSAIYPGANAKTVAETVATPIELEVNGVERMLYMSSRCTNDGQMYLDVTFEVGTNLDMAQVLVQNRVSIARSQAAGRSQAARRDHQEEIAGDPAVRQLDLARRELRPAPPEQFRLDEHQGRPGPAQGRRRRGLPRPARLQHAGLARPEQAGRPRHDGRRGRSRPSGNRTSRSPPAASASRRCPKARTCPSSLRSIRRAAWRATTSSARSS